MSDSDFPKWIERKPLRKKWFMSLGSGHCILRYPREHIELNEDRERQWKEFSKGNAGRFIYIFSSKKECLQAMERIQPLGVAAKARKEKIFSPGTYSGKLTKQLLMSLPTGAQLISHILTSTMMEPRMKAIVPPPPKRELFWHELKKMRLDGRTFHITVVESEK